MGSISKKTGQPAYTKVECKFDHLHLWFAAHPSQVLRPPGLGYSCLVHPSLEGEGAHCFLQLHCLYLLCSMQTERGSDGVIFIWNR